MLKLLALLFGALKFGKFGGTLVTMVLSMGAYALMFGWRFAVGFVLLILVHEMGHYLAARQRGLAVGAPTFIPFVGAWVQLKHMPHDAETEAYVGIAGPVLGSAAALALYFIAQSSGSHLLLALAYSGFFLNLFNLIPLKPLDGGRITAIVSPRMWVIGIPVLVALFVWRPSPMLILIALLALPQAWRNLRGGDEGDPALVQVQAPLASRVGYGLFYLGLAATLAILTTTVHTRLQAVI